MIEQYVFAWNQQNLKDYQKEFGKIWADNAEYADPNTQIYGVDALSQFAAKSLDIVPNRFFEVHSDIEHHHGYGRYTWKVTMGEAVNFGYDYFEFNEQFQITKLVSFFKLPEDYPVEKLS